MDLEHPENLLDHGQLVRSLAAALVHGAADVDDVVQGTWTAALTRPRPGSFPLPRWLSGIARNVARRSHRDRRRRTARETSASRPEALRSTAEVVELEELRRQVVAAVLSLGDPQRSIVLLRYYDGLAPRAIGQRLGMPAATVRSHLHRALANLRARLDRDCGGRAAWTALLLPIASAPVPLLQGIATMTVKIVLGTVLVATAALLYQTMRSPSLASEERVAMSTPPVATAPAASADLADAAARVAAPTPVEPVGPAVAPAATLRFVAADGASVAGDALRLQFESTRTQPTVLLLDTEVLERGGIDGILATRFGEPTAWQRPLRLEFAAGGGELRGLPDHGRYQLLIARPRAPAHLTSVFALPATAPLHFDVPLPQPGTERTVRAVAADSGAPLAGARIVAYTEFGDDRAFVAGTTVRTDERGEAMLNDSVPKNPLLIRPAIWWLETDDRALRLEPTAGGEVRVPRRGRLAGEAMRANGAPAAGFTVAFAADKGVHFRAQVDDRGRFELAGLPAAHGLVLLAGPTPADMRTKETTVAADATTEVLFPAPPASGNCIVGRITAGGAPLPGLFVVGSAGHGGQGRRMTNTAADGSYRLEFGADSPRFVVVLGDPDVSDDFTIQSAPGLTLQPDAATSIDFDLPGGCCPVRVLDDATGEPLPGVPVQARPARDGVQQDRFAGCRYRAGWAARTDAKGEALLLALPEGEPHGVKAGGNGFTVATVGVNAPATRADAERIVLRVRRQ